MANGADRTHWPDWYAITVSSRELSLSAELVQRFSGAQAASQMLCLAFGYAIYGWHAAVQEVFAVQLCRIETRLNHARAGQQFGRGGEQLAEGRKSHCSILPWAWWVGQPFTFLCTMVTKQQQSKRSFLTDLVRAFQVDAGEVVTTVGIAPWLYSDDR